MKIKLGALLAFISWNVAMADIAEDANARVHEYFAAFNAREVQRIAHEIYSTPVHIGGGAGHRILADPDAAVANLTDLYEMIGTQGWQKSVIEDLKTCMASATLALVDTRYSRIDNNGKPIPPAIRTNLYVLQLMDGAWRIVAFYGHDDDRRPSC